jgi:hypothetical protein
MKSKRSTKTAKPKPSTKVVKPKRSIKATKPKPSTKVAKPKRTKKHIKLIFILAIGAVVLALPSIFIIVKANSGVSDDTDTPSDGGQGGDDDPPPDPGDDPGPDPGDGDIEYNNLGTN